MDEHASFEPQAVLASRRRRTNSVSALVAALAVVAVVAIGVLGSRSTPPLDASSSLRADALEAVAAASPTPGPSLANFHPYSLPRYPAEVLGLQVWTAAYVSNYGLEYYSGTIAVSGWYAPQRGTGCPTPRVAEDPALAQEFGVTSDADTFCERTGELFTAPMYGENTTPIAVELRPGVAAPYQLKDVAILSPVVVVGRLTNPSSTCRAPRGCPTVLVVDNVAWAGGAGVPEAESVLPRLLTAAPPLGFQERETLSIRALGYQAPVLMEALVDPLTLARIDPHAADVLKAAAPNAKRIWYRRVLGADPAADPVHWVGIDDTTGKLIASGSAG